ncbi:hypothetical protein ACGFZL_08610 [Streptomyces sp. NPDC048182]|uniref:hypothetical protein n=1 Tax=Streptomyces sp. NPDC048182 TaxID=3365507 RepID=UPI00371AF0C7
MKSRYATKSPMRLTALMLTIGLTVGLAGCGGGDDDDKPQASSAPSRSDGSQPTAQDEGPSQTLAELKGPTGLMLKITSAQRDTGGFVTVSGDLKNDGSRTLNIPSQLSGNETEIIKNGRSLGGATLVDSVGKKRYYVLRDTEGRPLTTTNLPALKSGDSLPVFMQFPAPPSGTTELSLQLPMFSTAAIEVSG